MSGPEGRQKVDLTKFIEEHHFTFDRVFDETVDNEAVFIELILYSSIVR